MKRPPDHSIHYSLVETWIAWTKDLSLKWHRISQVCHVGSFCGSLLWSVRSMFLLMITGRLFYLWVLVYSHVLGFPVVLMIVNSQICRFLVGHKPHFVPSSCDLWLLKAYKPLVIFVEANWEANQKGWTTCFLRKTIKFIHSFIHWVSVNYGPLSLGAYVHKWKLIL